MDKTFEKYKQLTGSIYNDLMLIDVLHSNKKTMGLFRCVCGNEIKRNPSTVMSGNTTSCGCKQFRDKEILINTLINKTINYLTILEVSHRDKSGHLFYKCKCRCGNIKLVRRNSIIKGHIKSCGCWRMEISLARVGKKNGRYNPNITDEHRYLRDIKKRVSNEYNQFRNSVKKRDKYTCYLCKSPYELRVHHIESYASNEHLRYETSNGVTLCNTCHKIFHYLFGQFDNTAKQYKNFVGMFYTFGFKYLKILFINKQTLENYFAEFYGVRYQIKKNPTHKYVHNYIDFNFPVNVQIIIPNPNKISRPRDGEHISVFNTYRQQQGKPRE